MHSCEPNFPSIRSYAEANEFLAKAKPFPETKGEGETHPRRLEATRKRHMSIRLLAPHELEKVYVETFGEKGYDKRVHTDQSRLNLEANKGLRHIAFKLYSTDVVVWREDETVIFDPHVSKSTNAFVRNCTPHGLLTHWEDRACLVGCFTGKRKPYKWSTETYPTFDRYYRVAPSARAAFKRGPAVHETAGRSLGARGRPKGSGQEGGGEEAYWWPLGGIEPWDSLQVDRKAARAALRAHGWHDFELWAIGYCTMTKRNYKAKAKGRLETSEIMEILEDREKWPIMASSDWPDMPDEFYRGHGFGALHNDNLVERMANDPLYINKLHARRLAQRVKLAIYEKERCVTICNRDFLPSYAAVKSHFASHEKYSWRV